jgi:transposase
LGRSRGGLTTKINLVAASAETPVAVALTPGHTHDSQAWPELRELIPAEDEAESLSADKAYDSDAVRRDLAELGLAAVIPARRNRKEPPPCDLARCRRRNEIERLFNRLKQYRRIATRYDKLKRVFLTAIHLVCLAVMTK